MGRKGGWEGFREAREPKGTQFDVLLRRGREFAEWRKEMRQWEGRNDSRVQLWLRLGLRRKF